MVKTFKKGPDISNKRKLNVNIYLYIFQVLYIKSKIVNKEITV